MNQNDRALTVFAMLGHAMFHTYELVIPVFIVIWLDAFSTTALFLGIVVGASYSATGLGALPGGVLSDRFSPKRLIIGCIAGMGGGFLIISAAPNLLVLSVGLLVWGVAASVYHPAGLSLISRNAEDRGTAFAYHGIAGNIGVATGPLLGTISLVFFGWRTVAGLLVLPAIIAIALALRLEFDETTSTETTVTDGRGNLYGLHRFKSNSQLLFTGRFLFVFFIGILYGLYYRGAVTFLPDVFARLPFLDSIVLFGQSFEPIQYVYPGLLLLGGVGQYTGGKLVDRYPPEYVLASNFMILALVALAFVPAMNAGLWPLLAISGILGFSLFLEAPVNQEIISRTVPADFRGLSFGWTYIAVFGVGALGSALAGAILTRWSPLVLFGTLAMFAALAGVLGVALNQWPDDQG